jgi:hypothetical protein
MPLGNVLNVTGGRAEWAGMNASIQTVEEDIDNGVTRVTFGPPAHLNIPSVIEMLRTGRPPDWDTRAGGANLQPAYTGLL